MQHTGAWENGWAWWRHQMETFSVLLALCAGNSSVTGEFPSQRPVTRSFDVFSDLDLNKRSSKQSWGWWFETPWRSLWHHCNGFRAWHIQTHFAERFTFHENITYQSIYVLTGYHFFRPIFVVVYCLAPIKHYFFKFMSHSIQQLN